MNQQPQGLPLSYPWMALVITLSIIVPMTITGAVLGMLGNPLYWLLMAAIAGGSQASLYIAKRSWDVPTPRQ